MIKYVKNFGDWVNENYTVNELFGIGGYNKEKIYNKLKKELEKLDGFSNPLWGIRNVPLDQLDFSEDELKKMKNFYDEIVSNGVNWYTQGFKDMTAINQRFIDVIYDKKKKEDEQKEKEQERLENKNNLENVYKRVTTIAEYFFVKGAYAEDELHDERNFIACSTDIKNIMEKLKVENQLTDSFYDNLKLLIKSSDCSITPSELGDTDTGLYDARIRCLYDILKYTDSLVKELGLAKTEPVYLKTYNGKLPPKKRVGITSGGNQLGNDAEIGPGGGDSAGWRMGG